MATLPIGNRAREIALARLNDFVGDHLAETSVGIAAQAVGAPVPKLLTVPLHSVFSAHAKSFDGDVVPIRIGYYTASEAARLLKTTPRNISRWLGGYSYRDADGAVVQAPPLWRPQLPRLDAEGQRLLLEDVED